MIDVIKIAYDMLKIKDEITKIRATIKKRGIAYAEALADYRKAKAHILLKLEQNIPIEWDGEIVKDISKTNMREIAQGICWSDKLKESTAKALLDSAKKNLDAAEAQLSALQSINKHLDQI